ncbi:alpha/beta fold hydrolase [Prosthecobacter vanneervenii]|uniref:Pimeloyl-ACP methyl ester carboxylesterase n=1 Tax=Prosthecobacter vanneervenii TaxID=48466 RepID=A0A7W7YAC1_9BACT|nr:alpha/beta hydrolase [Prosthecobacter vanneervenii]MBB5032424.1 pimeloyl-ACP methyl ester carboxylesterase [Prosthecobacter vanneervenii]
MKSCLSLICLLVVTAAAWADEFTSGDVKIFYTVQGSGKPVVLIHGLHSSGAMNWTMPGITAALAQTHRVIVVDCRGHGKSDKPQTEDAYGAAMAEDVVALLDHLDIRRAHIVGYSMGGMIALKTAVLHPERVQGLLLCGMGWLPDGSALQGFWEHIPVRKRLLGGSSGSACMKGMARLAVTEAEVKALQMPTAVIVGDHDPVDRLYVAPLTQIRPGWPVTKIAGAGHLTGVVKPDFRDAVVKAIASFEN